ncbi:MFS transporter [Corynebacterium bovis]|uniref:MFS transporter n=1 Tax=Corynebacterium bovis TaxID=36808 RepID=UPI003138C365
MGWPRRWWALAVLSLGLVMLAVDVTVLNLAVPAIEADLAPSSTQMLWIVDVYGFVIGALLMTMGALGDRVGRRRLLLVGVAFFAVASVLAASATGPGQLIAARALQGAAGATLMPATLSLIRTMFTDDRERSRAVSVWVATYAVGAAAGPVIGGFLLEHFRWGAIFLINVPVAVVIVVAGLVTLPAGREGVGGDERPSPFDATGAVLSVVALFSGIYAVKTAVLEGVDAGVVVTAVVAVVVGVVFVRHLGRAAHPLVDPGMLRRPSYAAAVTVNAGTMFLFVGMLIVVSPLLQTVLGVTPLAAGLLFLPGLVVSGVVAVWVGGVMDRFSPALLITAGLVVSGLGLVVFVGCALGLLPGSDVAWVAVAYLLIAGGSGAVDPVTNVIVVDAAPAEQAGAAASLSEVGYELGGAVGTAVLGTVLAGVQGVRESGGAGTAEAFRSGAGAAGVAALVAAGLMIVLVRRRLTGYRIR